MVGVCGEHSAFRTDASADVHTVRITMNKTNLIDGLQKAESPKPAALPGVHLAAEFQHGDAVQPVGRHSQRTTAGASRNLQTGKNQNCRS